MGMHKISFGTVLLKIHKFIIHVDFHYELLMEYDTLRTKINLDNSRRIALSKESLSPHF